MNRCIVTGVSGRHRINRPRCTGALCSAWEEKFQCVRINRRHRVGLSDRLSRIIRRMSRQRRSKPWVIVQRACSGGHGILFRTGLSEAQLDKGVGAIVACLQAQEKKTLQDRMNRRPVGVTGRTIRRPPRQQFSLFENSTATSGL